jgi:hypothetical protein
VGKVAWVARGQRVFIWGTLCASLCAATLGCEGSSKLKDGELQSIDVLIKTGASFEDPYVRTETLRVLEVLADSTLDEFAIKATSDPSDMVAIQAMSTLIATKNPEFKRLLFIRWNSSKDAARQAMF